MPHRHPQEITQAFILCAGLGTRMRPLTDVLPKPLIPLFQAPMVTSIIERYRDMGIREFIVNTHHLAEKWEEYFPDGLWKDCTLTFVHEPVLLDTGGGLRNIRDLVRRDRPLLVHNGDIITSLDTCTLVRDHLESGASLTIALRSKGELGNVGFDARTGLITDMRYSLGVTRGTHEFASVYCIQPDVLDMIEPGGPVSIVPTMIELIKARSMRGVVLDEGYWYNVGNPGIYLDMHRQLAGRRIHPDASIPDTARLDENTVVGKGATIGDHCRLNNCIVWPNVTVPAGTEADNRVFYS